MTGQPFELETTEDRTRVSEMQTFVVRAWLTTDDSCALGATASGFVEHVASGATHRFHGSEQLAALIDQSMPDARFPRLPPHC